MTQFEFRLVYGPRGFGVKLASMTAGISSIAQT
jgi:hypothetical protein